MRVVFIGRISRPKMCWRVWQGECQIGFGAAKDPNMAEWLQITSAKFLI